MKILHLADLHIGKIVLEQSMLEDQKYMLNQIVEKIKDEGIELVLISGDVYDRTVPPSSAVSVLNDFLRTLVIELGVKVCVIAGNHDSNERLGFGSEILSSSGLYICTKFNGTMDKVTFKDEYGKLNVYMLPYIKPIDVKEWYIKANSCDEDVSLSYSEAVKFCIKSSNIDKSERNIILSHQFVTAMGVEIEKSDSETLSLGGTDNVDVSVYDSLDYVALGHIHGPQKLLRDTCRYAGTILRYSFSECRQNKSLCIVDLCEKGNININLCSIKPLHQMVEISGKISELEDISNYPNIDKMDYIHATITDEETVYDAIGRLKKVYPNILKLDICNSKTNSGEELNLESIEKVKQKSELELFNDFYNFQNGQDLTDKQIKIMERVIKSVKNVSEDMEVK